MHQGRRGFPPEHKQPSSHVTIGVALFRQTVYRFRPFSKLPNVGKYRENGLGCVCCKIGIIVIQQLTCSIANR